MGRINTGIGGGGWMDTQFCRWQGGSRSPPPGQKSREEEKQIQKEFHWKQGGGKGESLTQRGRLSELLPQSGLSSAGFLFLFIF